MILKRFYEDRLAQASFLLGCPASGEAIVIDPNRDAEQYIAAARNEGVRITTVTETHIHADFVSGSRELASRTGAVLAVSGEGGPDWQYSFGGQPGVQLLRDGDTIRAGSVCLTVRHTPGHTPEHLSFVLTDLAATAEPLGVFSGDFIFAGDVGRPDLLERAAGISGTMQKAARQLFTSLRCFRTLPERLLLWPGHGAGSACGKKLGGMPVTTLGNEKLANWAFQVEDESRFVQQILEDQPEPPRYFAAMKRINRVGAAAPATSPQPLSVEALAPGIRDGVIAIIDLRPVANFAEGFIPGCISITLNKSFLNWAGALLLPEREIYLIGEKGQIREAVSALNLIGLDRVTGWIEPAVVKAWQQRQGDVATIEQIDAARLLQRQKQGEVVLDVRAASEFRCGHIPGAIHISLGHLPEQAAALPRDVGVIVHCQGGTRSPIALSVLCSLGFQHVANFPGGFSEYQRNGLPIEKSATAEPALALPSK